MESKPSIHWFINLLMGIQDSLTKIGRASFAWGKEILSKYVSPIPLHIRKATAELLAEFWSWSVVGWVIAALLGFGLGMLSLAFTPMGIKALLAAGGFFIVSGAFLAIALLKWVRTSQGSKTEKIAKGTLVVVLIFILVGGELWLVHWVKGFVIQSETPPVKTVPVIPTQENKPPETKSEPKNPPPQMNPKSPPFAYHSPAAPHRPSAKQPTFKEVLGDFVVIVGGTPHTISRLSTKENPTSVAPFGDSRAIKAYVEDGRLYVDAFLYYAPDKPPLQLAHNELRGRPSKWDRNFDDSAIEIVDENLVPRFQLIYKDARTILLRGVFQFPSGAVVFEDTARFFVGSLENSVRIARIFKYPSRLNQGQELSDVQRSGPPESPPPLPVQKITYTVEPINSTSNESPYAIKVVIQTNILIQPISLVIRCSTEIIKGDFYMVGVSEYRGQGFGYVGNDKRNFWFFLADPGFKPETPLVVTLMAAEPIHVLAVQRGPHSPLQ